VTTKARYDGAMHSWLLVLAVAVSLAGCKNEGPATGQPDLAGCMGASCNPTGSCPAGTSTTLVGNVFAPNGKDRVPRATVYIPTGAVPAPKTGLSCDLCVQGAPPGAIASAVTRADGFFSISNPPVGEVTVVAELGRFRRVTKATVEACKQNVVPADSPAFGMRLPGKDMQLGPDDRAPHMAVATGDFDQIECVLKRMGFEQFDLYNDRDPGTALPATIGEFADLLRNPTKLESYQIVIVNCTKAQFEAALAEPQVLRNIEAYVGKGGRLYATDWAYDVIHQVPEFAPFLCFVQGGVTGPAPATTCASTPMSPRLAHSTTKYDTAAQITDDGLLEWLKGIPGALVNNQVAIAYNFVVINRTGEAPSTAKTWAKGLAEDPNALPMFSKGIRPLTVTFDYKQCGRVHYSTYNTEAFDVVPDNTMTRYPSCGMRTDFNPQERLLEYLIFEVAQCIGTVL
jgi:hypothetical protein